MYCDERKMGYPLAWPFGSTAPCHPYPIQILPKFSLIGW